MGEGEDLWESEEFLEREERGSVGEMCCSCISRRGVPTEDVVDPGETMERGVLEVLLVEGPEGVEEDEMRRSWFCWR